MFAYCLNNPVNYKDPTGNVAETVFDVITLGFSIIEVINNPRDFWAWAGLIGDVVDVAVPFVGGVGEVIKAAKVVNVAVETADTIHDTNKAIEVVSETVETVKVHGNSLSSTMETVGYVLRDIDTNEIMKYGETTRGLRRYTNKFYMENNVYMDIMTRGTKREMHMWQHEMILDYFDVNGRKPPMNKSFW